MTPSALDMVLTGTVTVQPLGSARTIWRRCVKRVVVFVKRKFAPRNVKLPQAFS